MLRIGLAIAISLVAAFTIVTFNELLVAWLVPEGTLGEMGRGPISALPLPLKMLVVVGWLVAAMAGAALAGLVARRAAIGWAPAILLALAGLITILDIPHPWWMGVAAIVAPLTGGWIGVRMARRSRLAPV